MLRSLRHYLRAQSQGHHTTDRLEERGVERGSARRSSVKGREKAIVSQTNIGTVSKATLWKLPRDGVELIWAFPSAQIPSWYHLELNWVAFHSAFLNIHRSGVLTVLAWLVPHETAAVSAQVLCFLSSASFRASCLQPCTMSRHFMQSHTRKVPLVHL